MSHIRAPKLQANEFLVGAQASMHTNKHKEKESTWTYLKEPLNRCHPSWTLMEVEIESWHHHIQANQPLLYFFNGRKFGLRRQGFRLLILILLIGNCDFVMVSNRGIVWLGTICPIGSATCIINAGYLSFLFLNGAIIIPLRINCIWWFESSTSQLPPNCSPPWNPCYYIGGLVLIALMYITKLVFVAKSCEELVHIGHVGFHLVCVGLIVSSCSMDCGGWCSCCCSQHLTPCLLLPTSFKKY